MVFLRDERGARPRSRTRARRRASSSPAGGACRSTPTRSATTARATMPRIEQLVLAAAVRRSDGDEAERRAYRARRRAERVDGRVRRVALVPHRRLQGALRGRPARRLLPRPARPGARGAVRDLPPALLDQHVSVVGARAAVPAALPQRRDQHDRRQRRWMRARGAARRRAARRPCSTTTARTRRCSTTRSSCSCAAAATSRHAHADARRRPRGRTTTSSMPERARLPPLPRRRSSSRGTGRPASSSPTVASSARRSTATACGRSATRSRGRPRRVRVRGRRVPLPDGARVRRGRLGPGEMLVVDPAGAARGGRARSSARLARAAPVRALARRRASARSTRASRSPPPGEDLAARQARGRLHAGGADRWSSARRDERPRADVVDGRRHGAAAARRPRASALHVLPPALRAGDEPADRPPARARGDVAAHAARRAARRCSSRGPEAARLLELESFFLFPSALDALAVGPARRDVRRARASRGACERLAAEAVAAVGARGRAARARRCRAPTRAADPVAARARRRPPAPRRRGTATRASLVVVSDEPRESAPLRLPARLRRRRDLPAARARDARRAGGGRQARRRPPVARRGAAALPPRDRGRRAQGRCRKMGISDVASYRGAQLFDALGLAPEVVELCFPGTPSPLGGVGFARARAGGARARRWTRRQLENPGYVKFRKGGEPHATTPAGRRRAAAARRARRARTCGWDDYERFAALVERPRAARAARPARARARRRAGPARRGRARRVDRAPLLERRHVARRALGGGARDGRDRASTASARARTPARAARIRARFRTERNSRIKQIASGPLRRHAASTRRTRDELQIKIAQGSKPGEGGQLPGHKVTDEIARLRHTTPGVALISPPPHHDIYSIEDLAQLVFDLRQVNPHADVSVKLVAEAGVGVVAAGVAKALADVVHIAGADGGTGASPLSSIKNAGAAVGARPRRDAADARRPTGCAAACASASTAASRPAATSCVAALLGADEVSFGTALLVAEGCLLVRSCHLDTCPVGIATQRPELRAKFDGNRRSDRRRTCASSPRRCAGTSPRSACGASTTPSAAATSARSASVALRRSAGSSRSRGGRYAREPQLDSPGGELGDRLAADARPRARRGAHRRARLRDRDTRPRRRRAARRRDRLRASARRRRPAACARGSRGSAGQSFGAFLAAGVELALTGEANDAVGKCDGRRPHRRSSPGRRRRATRCSSATRRSTAPPAASCTARAAPASASRCATPGAVAVVEGAGDHACEYMTGGTVVVLGELRPQRRRRDERRRASTSSETFASTASSSRPRRSPRQRPSSCARSSSATSASPIPSVRRHCSSAGTRRCTSFAASLRTPRSPQPQAQRKGRPRADAAAVPSCSSRRLG